MKFYFYFAPAFLSLIAFPAVSVAQNDLLYDLETCRGIENRNSRLDCFEAHLDRAIEERSNQKARQEKADIKAKKLAKENYGLPDRMAEDAITETVGNPDEAMRAYAAVKTTDALDAKIAGAKKNAIGKWIITLDNGQIWHETSASGFIGKVKVDQTARIKHGKFGGFRMYLDDKKRPLAVKRIK